METIDVYNDPFMSHTAAFASGGPPRGAGAPRGQSQRLEDVSADPFLTHQAYLVSAQPSAAPAGPRKIDQILGRGDEFRQDSGLRILVLLPLMTFVWVLLLWLVVRHYSLFTCLLLTAALGVWSIGCALYGLGKRGLKAPPVGTELGQFAQSERRVGTSRGAVVSLAALGALCLLAVIAATGFGQYGWHRFWRQLWWTQTGFHSIASSETPAVSRVDSAVLNFWADEGARKTVNGTRIGVTYSAGFTKGKTYCAAPILSPFSLAGGLARVNYWAIGIDCCETIGSFTCDYSREASAGIGVVMLEGGTPCPGCNSDHFQAAIAKAEAVHGLVSARGAMSVRWVRTTSDVAFEQTWQAVLYIVLCVVFAFLTLYPLAYIVWYYGYGRQAEEDFGASVRKKMEDFDGGHYGADGQKLSVY